MFSLQPWMDKTKGSAKSGHKIFYQKTWSCSNYSVLQLMPCFFNNIIKVVISMIRIF